MKEISKIEMIWNETNMFSRDIISSAWIDLNWDELPTEIQEQFASLVSKDIPREEFFK